MAKFRERCAIFLFTVSVLTMVAVLRVNPQLYSPRQDGTTDDLQDMPGIETFSNLKRSKMSYEMIYPSDEEGPTEGVRFVERDDVYESVSEDVFSNDDENRNFVLVTKEWIDNVVVRLDQLAEEQELTDNPQSELLPLENSDIEQLGESVPTDPPLLNQDNLQMEQVQELEESVPTDPHHPPNMTIILSESRSGSTWLLDVLAHPDNTMQFFEPLNGKLHARFLEFYGNEETPEVWRKNRQFKLSQICSCDLSTQWGAMSGWQRNYVGGYSGIRMPQVIDMCKSKQTRVAKTIRMYNISELAALPGKGCANFKVVHLVRDPRAVMLSRIETFHELYDGNHNLGPRLSGSQRDYDEDYMRRAARDYCSNQLYNHGVGHNPPSWLNYHLIKYEDLALTPLQSVKSIYSFIHQPFTEELSEFVFESSHGSRGRGGYATRKNSEEVAVSWKGRLLWRHCEVIQEECKEFMKVMGYQEISKAGYSLL